MARSRTPTPSSTPRSPRASSSTSTPTNRPPRRGDQAMSTDQYTRLTREELDQLAGEPLPERAAMSLVNANVAAPINAAVALNALSDGSTAYASATQTAPIVQGI